MSSTYKWKQKEEGYKATQQLHYIGIPVNGIIILGDKSPSNPPSALKNLDDLQWSVDGSVGLNYYVAKDIGVYFEPRLSNYFENNQPKSIRTDCSVSAGFGIGVQHPF